MTAPPRICRRLRPELHLPLISSDLARSPSDLPPISPHLALAGAEASDLSSIEISPCLRLAACGRSDGAINLCRFSRDALLESRYAAPLPTSPPMAVRSLYGHSGPVYSTAISRDSKFILSAGADGGVRLWSARHAS